MYPRLRKLLAGIATTLVVVSWAFSAFAVDGTFHAGASTFANTATNTVTFKVNTALAAGDQTTVSLNFASDGASTTPAAEFVTAGNIALAYAGTSQFSVAYGGTFSGPGSGPVAADINLIKVGGSIGKYVLTINYTAAASTLTGDWTLAFTGLAPTNTRVLVTMNSGGNLTNLAQVGVCGGGGGACPAGQSCKGPCPLCPPKSFCVTHPWACKVGIKWIPRWYPWPPGPGPCLSCPEPWKEKFGEEFERTILSFVALDKDGRELGPDGAKQVQLTVDGGRAVGGLVDLGGGEFAQMLEVRKGEAPPRVTANIAGATTEEFVAGPVAARKSSSSTVLGILLALSLAVIGYLATRNRGATRGG